MAENEFIRVVIVDDHFIVRRGLQLILEEAGDGFKVVGEADNGADALQIIAATHPDIVLMDIRMPVMNGIETLEQIRLHYAHIAVVMLTTFEDDALIHQSLQAGASGYLLKDTDRDTLFRTIRAAVQGETLLQPDILAHVLTATTQNKSTQPSTGPSILTEREHDVLVAVAQGERSKEIAQRLHISENTVKGYLANIYAKLGVDSRASAVMAAVERGLI
jgi:two-component system, NarL family, response regulator YdfI